ncbi:unnamed protein product [Orchesella dallaii]|uniref:Uncharacterized protein n=1 Tax=Orchesella dallaii TaxID=48710 RepID=A0ABP1RN29_9HEXA
MGSLWKTIMQSTSKMLFQKMDEEHTFHILKANFDLTIGKKSLQDLYTTVKLDACKSLKIGGRYFYRMTHVDEAFDKLMRVYFITSEQLKAVITKCQEMNQQMNKLKQINIERNMRLGEYERKLRKSDEEKQRCEEEKAELLAEVGNLTQKNAVLNAEKEELQGQINPLTENNAQLTKELDEYKRKLSNVKMTSEVEQKDLKFLRKIEKQNWVEKEAQMQHKINGLQQQIKGWEMGASQYNQDVHHPLKKRAKTGEGQEASTSLSTSKSGNSRTGKRGGLSKCLKRKETKEKQHGRDDTTRRPKCLCGKPFSSDLYFNMHLRENGVDVEENIPSTSTGGLTNFPKKSGQQQSRPKKALEESDAEGKSKSYMNEEKKRKLQTFEISPEDFKNGSIYQKADENLMRKLKNNVEDSGPPLVRRSARLGKKAEESLAEK